MIENWKKKLNKFEQLVDIWEWRKGWCGISRLIDLTEKRFGKLVAKEFIKKNNKIYWKCLCDCGNTCVIQSWELINKRRNCGRCEKVVVRGSRTEEDITGNKYNYLTALRKGDDYISPNGKKTYKWWFKCDCGNEKLISKYAVTSGRTKSCGCLAKKISSELNRKENIYDLSGEYGIGWTWNGDKFIFDKEDYDLIKDYCWRLDSRGYVITEISTENEISIIALARMIMFPPPNTLVSYKNGFESRFDNRKENLEIVQGASPGKEYFELKNRSGCVGVTERKGRNKKWRAFIRVDGTYIDLGSYYTFEEAVAARKKGEKMYGK